MLTELVSWPRWTGLRANGWRWRLIFRSREWRVGRDLDALIRRSRPVVKAAGVALRQDAGVDL